MEMGQYEQAREIFEGCHRVLVEELGEAYSQDVAPIESMIELAKRTRDRELEEQWQQKLRSFNEALVRAEASG